MNKIWKIKCHKFSAIFDIRAKGETAEPAKLTFKTNNWYKKGAGMSV